MDLSCDPPWLVARLHGPHAVASWAVVGGGVVTTDRVAWLQVRDEELGPTTDPVALLRQRLEERQLRDTVGMLTSASLSRHRRARVALEGIGAEAVATVGLTNRLAVGDPPGLLAVGTINLLVVLDRPLQPPALLEALSVAVEARTAAILALRLTSTRSRRPATGTGTDCVVVAAPHERDGHPSSAVYAGKHTPIGAAVGRAVYTAVHAGGRAWVERAR